MCVGCGKSHNNASTIRVQPEARGEGPNATGHTGVNRSGGSHRPVLASSVDEYGHQTPGLPAEPRSILSPMGRSEGSTRQRVHAPGAEHFIPAPTRHWPEMNQAQAGNPTRSAFGQTMIAHEGTTGLVDGPAGLQSYAPPLASYIHGAHGYDGFIGVNVFVSALQTAYVGRRGFSGEMPLSQQPTIKKAYPWLSGSTGSSTG